MIGTLGGAACKCGGRCAPCRRKIELAGLSYAGPMDWFSETVSALSPSALLERADEQARSLYRSFVGDEAPDPYVDAQVTPRYFPFLDAQQEALAAQDVAAARTRVNQPAAYTSAGIPHVPAISTSQPELTAEELPPQLRRELPRLGAGKVPREVVWAGVGLSGVLLLAVLAKIATKPRRR